ncbi:MAG: DegT/DnrJ/EryC1/StrS family aminotransferase [Verrucomicrobia bacterium]|jgi:perosamine synthetase|nr:DegT/DnrJ/EryC1/StrS family aminotransferase [Verrucomicrobiota bacterium]
MDSIPLMRPEIDEADLEAVCRVLRSGWLVQGIEVELFEGSIAKLHEAPFGIAVSSATAGLHLAFETLGVHKGEVIFIPSFAWPSAANMASRCGAEVVFVDVEPQSYNLCPIDLKLKIQQCLSAGKQLQGIVVVHEFGLAADMETILATAKDKGMWVVEDAACALGAQTPLGPVGTLGSMGIFSFHPRKSITTGEGGCIITKDVETDAQLRSLRNHGQVIDQGKRSFGTCGWNYRLTEFQAALGNVQLSKFQTMLSHRRVVAAWYHEYLVGVEGLQLPALDQAHTWQTFMTVLDSGISRDGLIADMKSKGVECSIGAFAAHLLPSFNVTPTEANDDCPVSTQLFNQGFSLPMHSFMDEGKVRDVSNALKASLRD